VRAGKTRTVEVPVPAGLAVPVLTRSKK